MERAKALFPSEILDKEKTLTILDSMETAGKNEEEPLWLLEKKSIMKALKTHNGNQSKVSHLLDIPRSSLHDKIKAYQIDVSRFKKRKEK